MLHSILNKYREAYSGLSKEVWLISIALLVNRAGAMVLTFLTLYFCSELGFTESESGILMATYGVAAIVGTLLGGKLTSWIGGINTQYLALSLSAPAFLLLGEVETFWTIAPAMVFLSVVSEAARPAATTATTEFAKPELHTRALALNRMAVNLGMAIGPVIGGMLAYFDYKLLFFANAISVHLSLLILFCNFGLQNSGQSVSTKLSRQSSLSTSPWLDMRFMIFMGWTLLTGIVFFQVIFSFPLYLKEVYLMNEYIIGCMMAINTAVIVLFEMVLIDYVKRFAIVKIIAIGSLLSCLGFGLLPFGHGALFCALTILVWTLGEMLSMPLTAAFVAQSSNDANRGSYMGVYTSTYAVALVIAPLLWMNLYRIDVNLVSYVSLGMSLIVFGGLWSFAPAPLMKRAALE